jgi:hypothetical protein
VCQPLIQLYTKCETALPPLPKNANGDAMRQRTAKNHLFVLQDRKRLPARFFAELSGLATAHLG